MIYGAAQIKRSQFGPDPNQIQYLWNEGKGLDTSEIARRLVCSEAEVYNVLASMRGQGA